MITSLKTTGEGAKKAQGILKDRIDASAEALKELNNIPTKILGFLILDLKTTIYKTEKKLKWYSHWKDFLLNTDRMFTYAKTFCYTLHAHQLATLTHDYVSTGRGRKTTAGRVGYKNH